MTEHRDDFRYFHFTTAPLNAQFPQLSQLFHAKL